MRDDYSPITFISPLLFAVCPSLLLAQQVYTPASAAFCTGSIVNTPVVGFTFSLRSSGSSLPPVGDVASMILNGDITFDSYNICKNAHTAVSCVVIVAIQNK